MLSPADTLSEAAITAAIIEMVGAVAPDWQPNTTFIRTAVAQVCGELDKTYPLTEDKYYSVAHLTEANPALLLGDELADDVVAVYQNDGKRAVNAIEFAKLSDTMITLELPFGLIDSFVTVTLKRPYSLSYRSESGLPVVVSYASNIPRQYAEKYVIPRGAARVGALLAAVPDATNADALYRWANHLLTTYVIPAAPTASSNLIASSVTYSPY